MAEWLSWLGFYVNMRTHNCLYPKIYSMKNLVLAWKRARKGKTRKEYVTEFERELGANLKSLHEELKNQTYRPKPLKTFILRDPKIRKISKSDFRDRVVHHALVGVIEPIFEKQFINDSCANRKGKGNLFAVERFYKFVRKVSRNGKNNGWFNSNQIKGYCFKADIKHYFQEISHEVLLKIVKEKIKDEKVIWLIKRILENNVHDNPKGKGMPLGNLTSQFFANVYLNELDEFVKHQLKARYYLRYVDDFIIFDSSREKLLSWGGAINTFLLENLKIELHPQKTKIISLSKGIDFVGFRNFYYYKLLRKRNVRNMKRKKLLFYKRQISEEKMAEIFQGWNAYAKWANAFGIREKIYSEIIKNL